MPLAFTDWRFSNAERVNFADVAGTRTDRLDNAGTRMMTCSRHPAGQVAVFDAVNAFATPLISTPGVSSLTLQGLDGDDTFNDSG